MSAIDKFRIPATAEDARQLRENRATLWPSMLLCIAIIVAIIVALMFWLGWLPVLVACLVIGLAIVAFLILYGKAHSFSEEEKRACEQTLPGHDIFAPEDVRTTGGKSYDFDCAPSDIFPYFRQFNLIKAGYYSFDWLERFFGFHIVNDYTIRPEWQEIKEGDWIYYHQNGAGTGIVEFKDNEYITTYSDTRYKPTQPLAVAWRPKWMKDFAWTWNFIFQPTNGGEGTHFITYLQAWWPKDTKKSTIIRLLVEWGIPSNVMMNGMARTVKKLAERDAKTRRAGKPRPGYNYTK
jgi:hypothetical protein